MVQRANRQPRLLPTHRPCQSPDTTSQRDPVPTESAVTASLEPPAQLDPVALGSGAGGSVRLPDENRVRGVLRVGVADDHAIFRECLKYVLAGMPDIEVVGEASDGGQAIELARRVEMDVLLLDLDMPNKGGLDALGSIRGQFPDLSVLILSAFSEEQYAITLIRLGAAGYLGKDTAPDTLIQAVRAVGSGKRYWSARVASMLATAVCGQRPTQVHDALTTREFQVFLRLAHGETVTAVGRGLALSYKTVSTHRTRLMRKLDLVSNSDLTAYAVKHGLMA
jgi:two-component system invasion response regulator UvrY